MTQSSKTSKALTLCSPEYYLNREASWVEFNARVLHEAMDDRTPLLERLKFLAIFSSNLDEYFMVRVAALKEQLAAGVVDRTPDGLSAQEQLELISNKLHPIVAQQHQHFEQVLRPKLADHGIHLLDYIDLNPEQRTYLQQYFEEQIFPVLTPLAVDPAHPFPHISNLSISLAVVVKDPDTNREYFARVKVPRTLPRFLPLPEDLRLRRGDQPAVWTGVPLEQVIAHNLEALFPGMNIQEYYPFRITRDADLSLQEDEADDLLLAIEQELRKRRMGGSVVRMEVPNSMPDSVRELLREELDLTAADIYEVEGVIGLRDLWSFMELPLPELKDKPWKSVVPPLLRRDSDTPIDGSDVAIEEGRNFFATIRRQDLLVHHPYHSFSATVQAFIMYAAYDPDVLAIKMTLYRTSGDSPIVNALIAAAENGKQVVVLVELKARFDEENNIIWARKLEQVGVHVVYGLVGLKTHTKVVLVVRKEENRMRRYVHIGTGNYNPKTARLYTDLGLLSCREELGADLTDLFNYLTGHAKQRSYRKLLVAPFSLRNRMVEMIQREAEYASQGGSGRIVAKMNALVDPTIITALYEASQAGVQIDLIIRGICCLRPGLPGVSDNIRVISIVGRLLEHSRIFYFFNNGAEQVFIGSADWMPRNLDRRVEAVVPVEDPALAKELQEILGIMLVDNRQAWEMQPDGSYIQRRPPADAQPLSSQEMFMTMAQNLASTS
ncbi:MAG: polyphosphate kinase 1 [Cyanobacteria bacterium]|nr:polyphosphate kinase 1 [Cyanobacteriota bacterium]MDW8200692.1 polyphosphate kinase 1 [Cyanobacteriota bacterium SKYGB_h_bin112]